MFYVLLKQGNLVYVTEQNPFTGTPRFAQILDDQGLPVDFDQVIDQHDMYGKNAVYATAGALWLTEKTGDDHLPCTRDDRNYYIARCPKVGDKVSYAFNGDYYPDGEIVKVTKTYQVTTSTGSKYRRRKLSGTWVKVGGTWSMVHGHISRSNMEF
jgi:hypothetical protein